MGATKSKRSFRPEQVSGSSPGRSTPRAPAPLPQKKTAPPPPQDADILVEQVGTLEDMAGKSMKTFSIYQTGCTVLIIQKNGEYFATGSKCTHYGANLENGVLGDDCVRCPWHGASFCIKTGDIEDFPGVSNLPTYRVEIKDGNKIVVTASKKALLANRRDAPLTALDAKNSSLYVVVGGGPAGMQCVSSLRENGYTGRIIFVLAENALPYDRVKLSKNLAVDVNTILLRDQAFYDQRGIEIRKGVQAVGLNTTERKIALSDGNSLQYDKIFISTGSRPRMLNIPGSTLRNVFTLRDSTNAADINTALTGFAEKTCNVVILGASFIGLEVASTLRTKCNVTVLCNTSVPFLQPLGMEFGAAIKKLVEEKGVKIHTERSITEILDDTGSGAVSSVKLTNGDVLPADILVMAIGVVPNTDFLKGSGVQLRPNGTIPVNEELLAVDNVYAGGDIAHAPVMQWDAAIGHIGVAQYHGKIAAANMSGKRTPLRTAPFFWTALFGKNFRYAGFSPEFDSVDTVGDIESLTFVSVYSKNGQANAVLTCGKDPIAAAFLQKLMDSPEPLKKDDVLMWLKNF